MKKNTKYSLIAAMTLLLILLTGCDADKVNNAVNAVGDAAGIELDSNIKQEQLDKAQDTIKEGVEKVKDIITDEEVQDAMKGLGSAIKDASKNDK